MIESPAWALKQVQGKFGRALTLVLGFVVQFQQYAVRVADEDLEQAAARHFAGFVIMAAVGQVFLHGLEAAADEGDVVDVAGVGLGRFVRPGNVDQVQDGPAFGINPCAGEGEAAKDVSDFVMGIRYRDRFERRQGEWRIADRQLLWEWVRTDPLPPLDSAWTQGTTDASDPVMQEWAAMAGPA